MNKRIQRLTKQNSYYSGGTDLSASAGALPPSLLSTTSNIVFSNGEYDPWRAAGVTESDEERGIVALLVEQVRKREKEKLRNLRQVGRGVRWSK
jgi:hypothetical protein